VVFLPILLQIIIALGILNVWLLRARAKTAYRGGDARSMREEFRVYGLPAWFMFVVGGFKLALAFALLLGVWFEGLAQPAAIGMGALMVGALAMHLKVKDPVFKALPAAAMLALCVSLALLT
jgi:hypothetical protein